MEKKELVQMLALEDFEPVYRRADAVRRENTGDIVHIRAIIEFPTSAGDSACTADSTVPMKRRSATGCR